ncbi:MAG: M4 family metallopeptidase [Bacteroidia bacterium]|nr:M4 family metallopeptidase [Bacteroidia bacterium]MDW8348006.1 M4 family metallopeptidase [Bacteroidia bacterium]
MKKLLYVCVWLILAQLCVAQEYYGADASEKVQNCTAVRYNSQSTAPVFLKLKDKTIPQQQGLTWLSHTLGASALDSWSMYRQEKDDIGFLHERYQQYYAGFPVEGGIYILHNKEGYLQSANGVFFKGISAATTPVLSEAIALQKALDYVQAAVYKWQIPEEENHIKVEKNDPQATYFPKGTLVIAPKNRNYAPENFKLSYKFDIYAHQPLSRQHVFVDAINGEIILTNDRIHNADSTGTAVTKFSGNRTIIADYVSPGNFRLREAGRCGVYTYNLQTGTSYSAAVDFTDTDNYWNNFNAQKDEVATDAHWGAEVTYDFFKNNFNRYSYNDMNSSLLSYVHYGVNYVNAFWDGSRMTYGDGNLSSGFHPLICLDVVAHEITHGVTEYSANLVYSYESGALNESFSDIFAKAVEYANKPSTFSWIVGKEMTTSGNGIRNMQNPNMHSDPDTYMGTHWYTGTLDNGGVHTNSGVQNYWFYLLCQGGSGVNDIGNSFSVSAIGFNKAQKIAYRNLTIYLTPTSEYSDARFYSIQSSIDLYGACSPEHEAVTRAWYAVGVGPNYIPGVNADFTASAVNLCSIPAVVNFTNTSVNGISFHWDFGNSTTSTLVNPTATYMTNGTYTVKLIANGGACGTDTTIKTAYITVNAPNPPLTTNDSLCSPGSATLYATPLSSGTVKWFSTFTGGTSFHTGTSYTIPSLTSTQTFYVSEEVPQPLQSVGPANNTFGSGGYLNHPNQHLVFDAYKDLILETVKVYANGAGNRTIQLRDNSGNVLQSATINMINGMQVVTLNFNVPAGTNYQLGLASSSSSNLYRNNSGVTFPYTITGLASIKTSSAGTSFYYFFYDWKVRETPCKSPRVPVTAVLNTTPATPNVTESGGVLYANVVAASYQWYLNGNPISGATASSYTPTINGVYSVVAKNGNCSSAMSAGYNFVISSINSSLSICEECVTVSPNPTYSQITLNVPLLRPATALIQMADPLGRIVFENTLFTSGIENYTIDMQSLAQGTYSLRIQVNEQIVRKNVIKLE